MPTFDPLSRLSFLTKEMEGMGKHSTRGCALFVLAAAIVFCFAQLRGLPVHASGADSLALAQLWVERLAATMQEHATTADVDRLLDIYADDAVYEHPHAGARIAGKALMRKGMSSHLGETRNPKSQIPQTITGMDFAIAEMNVKLEMLDDSKWVPLERRQVVVFEIKESHIQRIIDHWGN
jgi:ketosteroid isomerase-like protein